MNVFNVVLRLVSLCFIIVTVQTRMLALDGGLFVVEGVVLDEISGEPVADATIWCIRTGKSVTSQENGHFEIELSWSDSLLFSAIAYEPLLTVPPDTIFENKAFFVVKLKTAKYELEEFNVFGKNQVPLQLKSDVFREKPKVADYIVHPVSGTYYKLSKRERRKRQMLSMINQEKLMLRFAHVYNREAIAEESGLTDKALDYCIMYCNAHINLEEEDTDEMVKWKLFSAISDYLKECGEDIISE